MPDELMPALRRSAAKAQFCFEVANVYVSEIMAEVRGRPYNYGMTKGGTDSVPPSISGYLVRKYADNEDPSWVVIVTM